MWCRVDGGACADAFLLSSLVEFYLSSRGGKGEGSSDIGDRGDCGGNLPEPAGSGFSFGSGGYISGDGGEGSEAMK